jgi:hypothetical protein
MRIVDFEGLMVLLGQYIDRYVQIVILVLTQDAGTEMTDDVAVESNSYMRLPSVKPM